MPYLEILLVKHLPCLGAVTLGLVLGGCEQPDAQAPASGLGTPPVSVTPVSPNSQLPEGTTVITSPAGQQATPEQRKAVVDRLLAPADAPTSSTGLSPDAARAALKQDVKRRYPAADQKIIDAVVDAQHKDLVILSRRSDGTFDSAYYTKEVNKRVDDIFARYPPKAMP
jgi:hypothetical protein